MKKNLLLLFLLIVLGIAAWVVYTKSSGSTLAEKPLSDFAIEDTSRVTRIVITDHMGKTAQLDRIAGEKLWRLNNKYSAREDAVNLLLTTFKRISVRGNVGNAARNNMMTLLATSGKKVEIFTGGEEPEKIYYVGTPTPDHTGTIMLLEIPGIGRSEEPYITHMEGFTGFLSTRFFTDESDWRYTGIFDYPNLDFKDVKVINHVEPANSFEVKYAGGNNIELYDGFDPQTQTFAKREEKFDSTGIKNFLLLFKKVHVETFNTLLTKEAQDSLLTIAPTYTVAVTGNDGQQKKIDLYLKRAVKTTYDLNGNPDPWDVDHLWGRTDEGEFALAQTFNFGPILQPVQLYLQH